MLIPTRIAQKILRAPVLRAREGDPATPPYLPMRLTQTTLSPSLFLRVIAESVQSVAPVLPVAPSTNPKAAPAAFPSLTHEQPLHLDVVRHHGLRQRVAASTDKDRKRCSKEMDAIYDSTSFPKHMDTEQRGWYQELKGRWLPDNVSVRVSGSRTTVTHAYSCVVVSRSFRITDKPRKSSLRTYTLRSVQQLSSKYTTTLPRATTSMDMDRSKRYSAWTTWPSCELQAKMMKPGTRFLYILPSSRISTRMSPLTPICRLRIGLLKPFVS
jgi:hypothetical protein